MRHFPISVVYVTFCSIFCAVFVVRLYDDTPYFSYKRTTRQVIVRAD